MNTTDPRAILGVEAAASAEEIRAAYLAAVKRHPPDRDPEAFERIRDAYEALRDPRRRIQALLLAEDPDRPLAEWLDSQLRKRRFVGPGPWIDALRKA